MDSVNEEHKDVDLLVVGELVGVPLRRETTKLPEKIAHVRVLLEGFRIDVLSFVSLKQKNSKELGPQVLLALLQLHDRVDEHGIWLVLIKVGALVPNEVDGLELLLLVSHCRLLSGSDERGLRFSVLLVGLLDTASIVEHLQVIDDDPHNCHVDLVNQMNASLTDLVHCALLRPSKSS